MNLLRLPKLPSVAIACAVAAITAAGCSSSTADPEAHRSSHGGLTVMIPPGWQRVRLVDLPGADVPLEIASFPVRGRVQTVCDPHRIVRQIPAGGALLQILQGSGVNRRGAGAVSQASDVDQYPPLRKPFHLGALQSHECGEAYNVFFRDGGRVFQLRIWTAPTGLARDVRAQIEQLMDSLHASHSKSHISSPPVGPRTVGCEPLRRAILRGAATDFSSGTRAGPPHFEECLQSKLRRALDDSELASLVRVYRRRGGQQFAAQALNLLAAPLGALCGGSRYVPEMVAASEALRLGRFAGRTVHRLAVTYGPYIGVRCPEANSVGCDRIGLDVVLRKRAVAASASIGGRRISLTTPGLHSGVRGKDWVGSLANAGMARKGSPLYIRGKRGNSGIWAGYPPVYVPIQVTVTYADGRRRSGTFPHVFLSPGWG